MCSRSFAVFENGTGSRFAAVELIGIIRSGALLYQGFSARHREQRGNRQAGHDLHAVKINPALGRRLIIQLKPVTIRILEKDLPDAIWPDMYYALFSERTAVNNAMCRQALHKCIKAVGAQRQVVIDRLSGNSSFGGNKVQLTGMPQSKPAVHAYFERLLQRGQLQHGSVEAGTAFQVGNGQCNMADYRR